MMKNLALKSLLFTASLLLSVGASAGKSAPPKWANEPLVTGNECDTLTLPNVKNFLLQYAEDKELDKNSKNAAKKAMNTYTLASVMVNRSQLCLAQALALKDTTETLLKEKAILLGGSSMSKKEIARHREYSEAASLEIKAASQEAASLEPEQRKHFVLGISTYLTGTVATIKIKNDLSNYVKKTKDDLSTTAAQAKSGAFDSMFGKVTDMFTSSSTVYDILNGLPDHGNNLYDTGSYLMDYAQQQDLELPADATDEFLATSAW